MPSPYWPTTVPRRYSVVLVGVVSSRFSVPVARS
ncbi:MAG: hypothetical protein BWY52_00885 [Chloroflexi bacterium ADurb.Bin325]|nr:MAG: hypothetical protein BWY52_00885 [Chloroflexi bacterium ADurb.Bin325]